MDSATSSLYFTGQFYRCSKTKIGTLDALGPYRLWRIRPDGKHIATAEEEWVGRYKRGEERCGALEIVTLATGKRRALTTNLVSITGGFWQ